MTSTGKPDLSKPRIPLEYLQGLFGPRVGEALGILEAEKAKRARGEGSELMDILIAYRWPDHLFPDFKTDPATL